MSKTVSWLACALFAVLAIGCSKPDCDKAVTHTYKLLGDDAATRPEPEKAALLAAFPKQKIESMEECKAGKPRPLTADRYKCIMAAKARAELEKCAN